MNLVNDNTHVDHTHVDHICLDIEICRSVDQCRKGWDGTDEMGVSVCALYEYRSDRYRVYGPNMLDMLRKRIEFAERISGFNIFWFDLPVIFCIGRREWLQSKIAGELLPRTNDILRRIWTALGHDPDVQGPKTKGYKLEDVIRRTLPPDQVPNGKLMDGAMAPVYYQAGNWDRVTNYCLDDVQMERQLVDFVSRNGYVVNPDGIPLILNREQYELANRSIDGVAAHG